MKETKNNPRLIFIIIMDAVRPDHLSIYGYPRTTTPNLDKFLNDSIIFTDASSTSSWTPPAHASLISGLYPHQHKCYGDNFKLTQGIRYLPEILKAKNYYTLAISLTPYLSEQTGYRELFSDFIELWKKRPSWGISSMIKSKLFNLFNGSDNKTFESIDLIKKWIKKTSSDTPKFVFVNLITAHNPYKAPRKWNKKFLDELPGNYNKEIVKRLRDSGGYEFLSGKISADETDWEAVKIFYDQEIAYLDFQLGELFKFLKKENLFDPSEIFLLSDHGEIFGNHNLAYHTFGLYEELIKIPLIYKQRNSKGGARSNKPVSIIDIFPTILNSDKEFLNHDIHGYNLNKFQDIPDDRLRYFEFGKPGSIFKTIKKRNPDADISSLDYNFISVKKGNNKLLIKYKAEESLKFLYDIKADPGEEINLYTEKKEIASELEVELNKVFEIRNKNSNPEDSDLKKLGEKGLKKRLEDLGYL
ncbi:sulfatase [Candidatus Dependentiae bacterium]|nr:sulfatase [Candidatus Dependentiae bacterium]